MKNFDWTQFTREIAIEAPIQQLYNAWTIPSEIEKWFLSDATFKNSEGNTISKDNYINKGDSYEWRWFLWETTEFGKVTEANGKDHVQFTFADTCLVDLNFRSYDQGTIVKLKQSNIPTDDESKKNIRLGCFDGWSFYLVNLKSIYEGGLDLRNKNQELKMMMNN